MNAFPPAARRRSLRFGLIPLVLAVAHAHPGHDRVPEYEPTGFLKILREDGRFRLHTSAAEYELDGNRVTLVALVHAAPDAYRKKIGALLESAEAVVGATRSKDDAKRLEECARQLGLSVVRFGPGVRGFVSGGDVGRFTPPGLAGTEASGRRGTLLAAALDRPDRLAGLVDAGDPGARNDAAMAALHRQLAAGRKRVVVLLGAGRAADMEHRLVSQGFQRRGTREFHSWSAPAPPGPP